MSDEKGQLLGRVTHYFNKIGVAVIELTAGDLKVGDTIKIERHEGDFDQLVNSMQVNHQEVQSAKTGESFGLKVDQPVKAGNSVYKIS